MAAALRAAEGGVYFFQILRGGGIFKIFPARGVYPPTPLFPTPGRDIMFCASTIEKRLFTLLVICQVGIANPNHYVFQTKKNKYQLH